MDPTQQDQAVRMPAAPPTLFDFLGEETSNAEERAAFHMRLRAQGIEAFQAYGTADLGTVAYESPAREGLLVDEELLLEIVRPGTTPSVETSVCKPPTTVVSAVSPQRLCAGRTSSPPAMLSR